MSHYNLTAKGEGAEALGQVVDIVVEHEYVNSTVLPATDIVESSALALVHAINAIYRTVRIKWQILRIINSINLSSSPFRKEGKIRKN